MNEFTLVVNILKRCRKKKKKIQKVVQKAYKRRTKGVQKLNSSMSPDICSTK